MRNCFIHSVWSSRAISLLFESILVPDEIYRRVNADSAGTNNSLQASSSLCNNEIRQWPIDSLGVTHMNASHMWKAAMCAINWWTVHAMLCRVHWRFSIGRFDWAHFRMYSSSSADRRPWKIRRMVCSRLLEMHFQTTYGTKTSNDRLETDVRLYWCIHQTGLVNIDRKNIGSWIIWSTNNQSCVKYISNIRLINT